MTSNRATVDRVANTATHEGVTFRCVPCGDKWARIETNDSRAVFIGVITQNDRALASGEEPVRSARRRILLDVAAAWFAAEEASQ